MFVFEISLLCLTIMGLFDQQYSKSNIIKLLNCNLFLLSKHNFQPDYSSLQCHMIRDAALNRFYY